VLLAVAIMITGAIRPTPVHRIEVSTADEI
jgi:hypothetical protein